MPSAPTWAPGPGVLARMSELGDSPRSNEMYNEPGSMAVGEKFLYSWIKSSGELVRVAWQADG